MEISDEKMVENFNALLLAMMFIYVTNLCDNYLQGVDANGKINLL